jgi:hypothetical protein
MVPGIVFFGLAVLSGVSIREIVRRRLRGVTRRGDVSHSAVCELEHAKRIASIALLASLAGLALAGLSYVVF